MSTFLSSENAMTVLSTVGSIAASSMLIRSIFNDFLPEQVHEYFNLAMQSITRRLSTHVTVVVEEYLGFSYNEVFEAATLYLGTVATTSSCRIKVGKDDKDKTLALAVDVNEEVIDVFDKVVLRWKLVTREVKSSSMEHMRSDLGSGSLNSMLLSEVRSYELSFHKKYKDKVLNSYLPFIMKKSRSIQDKVKAVKLYTSHHYNGWDTGKVVALNHPMTFRTLAIDPGLKKVILEDLDNFINGEEYYRSIGKAWKRGYLLYGPPGTGKSSLIAAIANHLNFDIYDLDLSEVASNMCLKHLMLGMSRRSILIVEDIDCSPVTHNRYNETEKTDADEDKVTLSGLLNAMDGLMSCCGEARIIIFTTNHRERLDPALLRPGRMDMHICLSYCTVATFRELVFNYLGLQGHRLFPDIEEVIGDASVTPAEVAGELMKSRKPDTSLQGLLMFLQNKIAQQDTAA